MSQGREIDIAQSLYAGGHDIYTDLLSGLTKFCSIIDAMKMTFLKQPGKQANDQTIYIFISIKFTACREEFARKSFNSERI